MDAAKRDAIAACGRCGQPERAHQHKAGEDEESIAVLFALGAPCPAFVASDAAVIYQKAPGHRRQPGAAAQARPRRQAPPAVHPLRSPRPPGGDLPVLNTRPFRRRLPWLCGCHDPSVFGHLEPCVWWQTQPRQSALRPGWSR
jgi:hypothetical protein